MVLSRAIANNIYTICGTPSLERRYPASRNGGFTAQEYSITERTISGHDISDVAFEQFIDAFSDQCISKIVEMPFVFIEICR